MSQLKQRQTEPASAREPEPGKFQLKHALLVGLVIALIAVFAFASSGASAKQDGSEVVLIVPDETEPTIALPYRTVSAVTGAPVAMHPVNFALDRETTDEIADFDLEAVPDFLQVCAPDDAVYNVQVQSLFGFTNTVTLSLSGEPINTTIDFSPNGEAAPYTSTMTISDTGSAAIGSYDMEITGVSVTATHTITVGLDLFDASPGTVVLTSPSDGAVGVSTRPLFIWAAATQGNSYTIEVDDDPGFSSIDYSATVTGTTRHMTESHLDQWTIYYWQVRPANFCGTGSASAVFSFTTRDVSPVLLVDDDDNNPDTDVRSTYTETLDTLLGVDGYDIWDTENSDDEPDADTLSFHDVVIWFTGKEFGDYTGPGNEGEAALATWLDSSGCLFISSQDYHYAKGLTPFMADYLGVITVTNDTGQVDLIGENTVFAGLGPYTMNYPFTDYSDEMTPDNTAEVAFTGTNPNGSNRPAAVNKQGATYVTAFLGFPWEAIDTAGGREEVLATFLNWCAEYDIFLPLLLNP